jgi:hypothetical protein
MMRQRTAGAGAAIPLIAVVVLTFGVTTYIFQSRIEEISLPRTLLPTAHQAAQERPVDGATPVTQLSVSSTKVAAPPAQTASEAPATAPATAPAEPPSQPADLAVGARARVANTDNLGVVFYAAPRDNARQPAGLLEGTVVTVLERSGDEWARVQSDSKKSGWVRAQYLVPAE